MKVGHDSSVSRLAVGWTFRGSNPSRDEIFRTHPASCTMGIGSFPRVRWTRRGIDHPPLSSAKVQERVGLHLYSPFWPLWPVLGWTLLGLRQWTSCIEKLKKLQILTAPNLYVLQMMFVIKNPDKYQTNVSIQSQDMRQFLKKRKNAVYSINDFTSGNF
jgi:hypothetical protein